MRDHRHHDQRHRLRHQHPHEHQHASHDPNNHHRRARRFGKRLYVRVWLAILASLTLVALLAGAVWHFTNTQVPREIIITDALGQRVGVARMEFERSAQAQSQPPSQQKGPAVRIEQDDGKVFYARWNNGGPRGPFGGGFGFIGWLVLIVFAVGLGAYPVVKRLTRRLDQLQQGVDALGEGNLAARVPVRGHDEIAWLAERFNHAAARIEALVNSHKTLLANASHELRSPLARIRMGLELLDVTTDSDAANAAKTEIARSITELDQLIEEILLASRLDATDAPAEAFEEIDLTALAAEECARGGADLDADGVVTLAGNERLLRRLTRNLIENARRHGGGAIAGSDRTATPAVQSAAPPSPPVDVSLGREGGSIILAVCDRGRGVPEAERERIFEPFYRLRGASESGGGAGLGLALVRSIAVKHGGSVTCAARAGGGACFRVVLPG